MIEKLVRPPRGQPDRAGCKKLSTNELKIQKTNRTFCHFFLLELLVYYLIPKRPVCPRREKRKDRLS